MKIFYLLFLLITSVVYSQNSPEKLLEEFTNRYEKEGSVSALEFLISTSPYMSTQSEVMQKMKNQITSAETLLGKYKGAEFINSKSVGKSLTIFTYLMKYERQPLRFNIILYNAEKNWMLYYINFNDSFVEELEGSVNFY